VRFRLTRFLTLLASLALPCPVAAAFLTAAAMLSGYRRRNERESPCKPKRAQH
jgi:hypothetical protein